MATRWLPVPDSITTMLSLPKAAVDLSSAIPVIEAVISGIQDDLPQTLEDFPKLKSTGQWLSRKVAAELGFIVGSAMGSYSYNTYVQQLTTWVEIPDETGNAVVRYGLSARYIVTVEEINVGAKLNSISGIAASASYESLRASAEFSTLGIPASWIIDQVPSGGSFNLDKYLEFEGALKGVRKILKEREADILKPQVLEVKATVNDEGTDDYEEALAVSWALSCIARRLTLSYANSDYKKASHYFKSVVETIYARVAGVSGPDEKPSKLAGEHAEQRLNGLRMEES